MSRKITREEADRRVEEYMAWVGETWASVEYAIQAIVRAAGVDASKAGLATYCANGEYIAFICDEVLYLDPKGSWQVLARDDEFSDLWGELERAASEFGSELPPGEERTITEVDELDMGNLEMMLFADYDGDGWFQYDENGMKTIIEDTWF